MKKTNKKGFTIVELVIVIAVIAILAAVLIPTFSGVVKKAENSRALQEAKNAYTVAIAECLSNDGAVSTSDTTVSPADPVITVAANATTTTNFDVTYGDYTFEVTPTGTLVKVTRDGYTYTVTSGTLTAAVKN